MKKDLIVPCLIVALFLFLSIDAEAQCAMCKATAESSLQVKDGKSAGAGINKGILYIMFIPYALIMTLAGVFFKEHIKRFFSRLF